MGFDADSTASVRCDECDSVYYRALGALRVVGAFISLADSNFGHEMRLVISSRPLTRNSACPIPFRNDRNPSGRYLSTQKRNQIPDRRRRIGNRSKSLVYLDQLHAINDLNKSALNRQSWNCALEARVFGNRIKRYHCESRRAVRHSNPAASKAIDSIGLLSENQARKNE